MIRVNNTGVDRKLSPEDIITIERIYLLRFQEKGTSKRGMAEDWFNVIISFIHSKNLELAPKGTLKKYTEVFDAN